MTIDTSNGDSLLRKRGGYEPALRIEGCVEDRTDRNDGMIGIDVGDSCPVGFLALGDENGDDAAVIRDRAGVVKQLLDEENRGVHVEERFGRRVEMLMWDALRKGDRQSDRVIDEGERRRLVGRIRGWVSGTVELEFQFSYGTHIGQTGGVRDPPDRLTDDFSGQAVGAPGEILDRERIGCTEKEDEGTLLGRGYLSTGRLDPSRPYDQKKWNDPAERTSHWEIRS